MKSWAVWTKQQRLRPRLRRRVRCRVEQETGRKTSRMTRARRSLAVTRGRTACATVVAKCLQRRSPGGMHTLVGASFTTQHASVAGTCLTISSTSNIGRSPTVLVFGTTTESSSQTSPVVFRVLNRALLPPFLSQFLNDTYLDSEIAVEHAGSRHGSFAMASSCACNQSHLRSRSPGLCLTMKSTFCPHHSLRAVSRWRLPRAARGFAQTDTRLFLYVAFVGCVHGIFFIRAPAVLLTLSRSGCSCKTQWRNVLRVVGVPWCGSLVANSQSRSPSHPFLLKHVDPVYATCITYDTVFCHGHVRT